MDTFTIDGNTYAIVAAFDENGVQIIDISNPASPSPAGKLIDNGFATALAGASGVDTFTLTGTYAGTYAIVASKGDNAVQIIDVSNPASPSPAGKLIDNGFATALAGASGVDTFTLTGTYAGTYAIVAAFDDNGVQIIDISNPASPSPAGKLIDNGFATALAGASGVDTWSH